LEGVWLANPADPVPSGKGISVDGLFLPQGETDWNKSIIQPAFYFTTMKKVHILKASFRPRRKRLVSSSRIAAVEDQFVPQVAGRTPTRSA